jgi:uncharacterized protein YukE
MGQRYGADPEQLDAFASTMAQSAERLHAIRSEVAAALNRTVWFGADADDFSWTWYQQVSPSLARVATACDHGAQTLRVNAAQQRGTSSVEGGPFSGVLLSPGGGGSGGAGEGRPLPDYSEVAAGLTGVFLGGMGLIHGLFEHAKVGPGMAGVLRAGKLLGAAGDVIALVTDGPDAFRGLMEDPGSTKTFNSTVSATFAVAGLVMLFASPAAPVAVGVGVAGLAFSVAKEINPELPKQIVEGVGNAASDLAEDVVGGVRSLFSW